MKKVYTIEDIAKELGVSKTTVSRAISGKGRIGRETTQRVMDCIREHDYRPNVLAKGLAQNKTYNLGLVLPKEYTIAEAPFFRECMKGIFEVSAAHDYDIVLSMTDQNDFSQIRRQVHNLKVDGVLISRATTPAYLSKYLKEKGIPFVVIGESHEEGARWVDNKNREASGELTEMLLLKGARRLSILGGNLEHQVSQSRLAGFVDAHEKLGRHVEDSQIYMGIDTPPKAIRAVSAACETGSDGIICMDDYICIMVIGALYEKKIEVPGQMRLASLYESNQLERNQPPVTSLKFSTADLGRCACLMLLQMLGEEIQEEMPALNYQVLWRESTQ